MASSDVSRSAVIRGLRNIEGERGASSNMVGVAIASYNSSGRSSAWYFAWYWCHPTVELTSGVRAVSIGRIHLPAIFLGLGDSLLPRGMLTFSRQKNSTTWKNNTVKDSITTAPSVAALLCIQLTSPDSSNWAHNIFHRVICSQRSYHLNDFELIYLHHVVCTDDPRAEDTNWNIILIGLWQAFKIPRHCDACCMSYYDRTKPLDIHAWPHHARSPPLHYRCASILEVNIGNYSRCIPTQAKWITNKIEDIYCYYCRYRKQKYFRICKEWKCYHRRVVVRQLKSVSCHEQELGCNFSAYM